MEFLKYRAFPNFLQDYAPKLIEFFGLWTDWLNKEENSAYIIDHLSSEQDIDESIDAYKTHIRNKLIVDFPADLASDLKLLLKNIFYFYNAKSSVESYEFLFRCIFDSPATLTYPKEFMLRLSDGRWNVPHYIAINTNVSDDIVSIYKNHYNTIWKNKYNIDYYLDVEKETDIFDGENSKLYQIKSGLGLDQIVISSEKNEDNNVTTFTFSSPVDGIIPKFLTAINDSISKYDNTKKDSEGNYFCTYNVKYNNNSNSLSGNWKSVLGLLKAINYSSYISVDIATNVDIEETYLANNEDIIYFKDYSEYTKKYNINGFVDSIYYLLSNVSYSNDISVCINFDIYSNYSNYNDLQITGELSGATAFLAGETIYKFTVNNNAYGLTGKYADICSFLADVNYQIEISTSIILDDAQFKLLENYSNIAYVKNNNSVALTSDYSTIYKFLTSINYTETIFVPVISTKQWKQELSNYDNKISYSYDQSSIETKYTNAFLLKSVNKEFIPGEKLKLTSSYTGITYDNINLVVTFYEKAPVKWYSELKEDEIKNYSNIYARNDSATGTAKTKNTNILEYTYTNIVTKKTNTVQLTDDETKNTDNFSYNISTVNYTLIPKDDNTLITSDDDITFKSTYSSSDFKMYEKDTEIDFSRIDCVSSENNTYTVYKDYTVNITELDNENVDVSYNYIENENNLYKETETKIYPDENSFQYAYKICIPFDDFVDIFHSYTAEITKYDYDPKEQRLNYTYNLNSTLYNVTSLKLQFVEFIDKSYQPIYNSVDDNGLFIKPDYCFILFDEISLDEDVTNLINVKYGNITKSLNLDNIILLDKDNIILLDKDTNKIDITNLSNNVSYTYIINDEDNYYKSSKYDENKQIKENVEELKKEYIIDENGNKIPAIIINYSTESVSSERCIYQYHLDEISETINGVNFTYVDDSLESPKIDGINYVTYSLSANYTNPTFTGIDKSNTINNYTVIYAEKNNNSVNYTLSYALSKKTDGSATGNDILIDVSNIPDVTAENLKNNDYFILLNNNIYSLSKVYNVEKVASLYYNENEDMYIYRLSTDKATTVRKANNIILTISNNIDTSYESKVILSKDTTNKLESLITYTETKANTYAKNTLVTNFWNTSTKGMLSSDMVFQDSHYYQDFSYSITSQVSMNKWKKIVKTLIHPAGLEFFANLVDEKGEDFETNSEALDFLRLWHIAFKTYVFSVGIETFSRTWNNKYLRLTQKHSETLDAWLNYGRYHLNGYEKLQVSPTDAVFNRSSVLLFRSDNGTLIHPNTIDWTNFRFYHYDSDFDEANNTWVLFDGDAKTYRNTSHFDYVWYQKVDDKIITRYGTFEYGGNKNSKIGYTNEFDYVDEQGNQTEKYFWTIDGKNTFIPYPTDKDDYNDFILPEDENTTSGLVGGLRNIHGVTFYPNKHLITSKVEGSSFAPDNNEDFIEKNYMVFATAANTSASTKIRNMNLDNTYYSYNNIDADILEDGENPKQTISETVPIANLIETENIPNKPTELGINVTLLFEIENEDNKIDSNATVYNNSTDKIFSNDDIEFYVIINDKAIAVTLHEDDGTLVTSSNYTEAKYAYYISSIAKKNGTTKTYWHSLNIEDFIKVEKTLPITTDEYSLIKLPDDQVETNIEAYSIEGNLYNVNNLLSELKYKGYDNDSTNDEVTIELDASTVSEYNKVLFNDLLPETIEESTPKLTYLFDCKHESGLYSNIIKKTYNDMYVTNNKLFAIYGTHINGVFKDLVTFYDENDSTKEYKDVIVYRKATDNNEESITYNNEEISKICAIKINDESVVIGNIITIYNNYKTLCSYTKNVDIYFGSYKIFDNAFDLNKALSIEKNIDKENIIVIYNDYFINNRLDAKGNLLIKEEFSIPQQVIDTNKDVTIYNLPDISQNNFNVSEFNTEQIIKVHSGFIEYDLTKDSGESYYNSYFANKVVLLYNNTYIYDTFKNIQTSAIYNTLHTGSWNVDIYTAKTANTKYDSYKLLESNNLTSGEFVVLYGSNVATGKIENDKIVSLQNYTSFTINNVKKDIANFGKTDFDYTRIDDKCSVHGKFINIYNYLTEKISGNLATVIRNKNSRYYVDIDEDTIIVFYYTANIKFDIYTANVGDNVLVYTDTKTNTTYTTYTKDIHQYFKSNKIKATPIASYNFTKKYFYPQYEENKNTFDITANVDNIANFLKNDTQYVIQDTTGYSAAGDNAYTVSFYYDSTLSNAYGILFYVKNSSYNIINYVITSNDTDSKIDITASFESIYNFINYFREIYDTDNANFLSKLSSDEISTYKTKISQYNTYDKCTIVFKTELDSTNYNVEYKEFKYFIKKTYGFTKVGKNLTSTKEKIVIFNRADNDLLEKILINKDNSDITVTKTNYNWNKNSLINDYFTNSTVKSNIDDFPILNDLDTEELKSTSTYVNYDKFNVKIEDEKHIDYIKNEYSYKQDDPQNTYRIKLFQDGNGIISNDNILLFIDGILSDKFTISDISLDEKTNNYYYTVTIDTSNYDSENSGVVYHFANLKLKEANKKSYVSTGEKDALLLEELTSNTDIVATYDNYKSYITIFNGDTWTNSEIIGKYNISEFAYGYTALKDNSKSYIYLAVDGTNKIIPFVITGTSISYPSTKELSVDIELNSICFDNEKFIAVGSNGSIVKLTYNKEYYYKYNNVQTNSQIFEDTINYEIINLSDNNGNKPYWNKIIFVETSDNENMYFAIGDNGYYAYSRDGNNWTVSNISEELSTVIDLYTILYGKYLNKKTNEYEDKFLIFGKDGYFVNASYDTDTFTFSLNKQESITYGYYDNKVYREHTINDVYDGYFSKNVFIVVDESEYFSISYDGGETWNYLNYTADAYWNSISYYNDKFIASGENSKILSISPKTYSFTKSATINDNKIILDENTENTVTLNNGLLYVNNKLNVFNSVTVDNETLTINKTKTIDGCVISLNNDDSHLIDTIDSEIKMISFNDDNKATIYFYTDGTIKINDENNESTKDIYKLYYVSNNKPQIITTESMYKGVISEETDDNNIKIYTISLYSSKTDTTATKLSNFVLAKALSETEINNIKDSYTNYILLDKDNNFITFDTVTSKNNIIYYTYFETISAENYYILNYNVTDDPTVKTESEDLSSRNINWKHLLTTGNILVGTGTTSTDNIDNNSISYIKFGDMTLKDVFHQIGTGTNTNANGNLTAELYVLSPKETSRQMTREYEQDYKFTYDNVREMPYMEYNTELMSRHIIDYSNFFKNEQKHYWELKTIRMIELESGDDFISTHKITLTIPAQNHSELMDDIFVRKQYSDNMPYDWRWSQILSRKNESSTLVFDTVGKLIDPEDIDWFNKKLLLYRDNKLLASYKDDNEITGYLVDSDTGNNVNFVSATNFGNDVILYKEDGSDEAKLLTGYIKDDNDNIINFTKAIYNSETNTITYVNDIVAKAPHHHERWDKERDDFVISINISNYCTESELLEYIDKRNKTLSYEDNFYYMSIVNSNYPNYTIDGTYEELENLLCHFKYLKKYSIVKKYDVLDSLEEYSNDEIENYIKQNTTTQRLYAFGSSEDTTNSKYYKLDSYYTIGNNEILITSSGLILYEGIHYQEVKINNTKKSNIIKILDNNINDIITYKLDKDAIIIKTTNEYTVNDDSTIDLAFNYTVGENNLLVTASGTILYNNEQYEEIGNQGEISSKIKIRSDLLASNIVAYKLNENIIENIDIYDEESYNSIKYNPSNELLITSSGLLLYEGKDNQYEINTIINSIEFSITKKLDNVIVYNLLKNSIKCIANEQLSLNAYKDNNVEYSIFDVSLNYTVGTNAFMLSYNGLLLYNGTNYQYSEYDADKSEIVDGSVIDTLKIKFIPNENDYIELFKNNWANENSTEETELIIYDENTIDNYISPYTSDKDTYDCSIDNSIIKNKITGEIITIKENDNKKSFTVTKTVNPIIESLTVDSNDNIENIKGTNNQRVTFANKNVSINYPVDKKQIIVSHNGLILYEGYQYKEVINDDSLYSNSIELLIDNIDDKNETPHCSEDIGRQYNIIRNSSIQANILYEIEEEHSYDFVHTLDFEYTVGYDELLVSYNGLILYKDVNYEEIGDYGKKSNKIRFILQGDDENEYGYNMYFKHYHYHNTVYKNQVNVIFIPRYSLHKNDEENSNIEFTLDYKEAVTNKKVYDSYNYVNENVIYNIFNGTDDESAYIIKEYESITDDVNYIVYDYESKEPLREFILGIKDYYKTADYWKAENTNENKKYDLSRIISQPMRHDTGKLIETDLIKSPTSVRDDTVYMYSLPLTANRPYLRFDDVKNVKQLDIINSVDHFGTSYTISSTYNNLYNLLYDLNYKEDEKMNFSFVTNIDVSKYLDNYSKLLITATNRIIYNNILEILKDYDNCTVTQNNFIDVAYYNTGNSPIADYNNYVNSKFNEVFVESLSGYYCNSPEIKKYFIDEHLGKEKILNEKARTYNITSENYNDIIDLGFEYEPNQLLVTLGGTILYKDKQYEEILDTKTNTYTKIKLINLYKDTFKYVKLNKLVVYELSTDVFTMMENVVISEENKTNIPIPSDIKNLDNLLVTSDGLILYKDIDYKIKNNSYIKLLNKNVKNITIYKVKLDYVEKLANDEKTITNISKTAYNNNELLITNGGSILYEGIHFEVIDNESDYTIKINDNINSDYVDNIVIYKIEDVNKIDNIDFDSFDNILNLGWFDDSITTFIIKGKTSYISEILEKCRKQCNNDDYDTDIHSLILQDGSSTSKSTTKSFADCLESIQSYYNDEKDDTIETLLFESEKNKEIYTFIDWYYDRYKKIIEYDDTYNLVTFKNITYKDFYETISYIAKNEEFTSYVTTKISLKETGEITIFDKLISDTTKPYYNDIFLAYIKRNCNSIQNLYDRYIDKNFFIFANGKKIPNDDILVTYDLPYIYSNNTELGTSYAYNITEESTLSEKSIIAPGSIIYKYSEINEVIYENTTIVRNEIPITSATLKYGSSLNIGSTIAKGSKINGTKYTEDKILSMQYNFKNSISGNVIVFNYHNNFIHKSYFDDGKMCVLEEYYSTGDNESKPMKIIDITPLTYINTDMEETVQMLKDVSFSSVVSVANVVVDTDGTFTVDISGDKKQSFVYYTKEVMIDSNNIAYTGEIDKSLTGVDYLYTKTNKYIFDEKYMLVFVDGVYTKDWTFTDGAIILKNKPEKLYEIYVLKPYEYNLQDAVKYNIHNNVFTFNNLRISDVANRLWTLKHTAFAGVSDESNQAMVSYNLVNTNILDAFDYDSDKLYNTITTRMLETDDISSINYYNLLSRKMLETNDIDFSRYYNLVHSTSILSNDLDFSNYYNLLSTRILETDDITANNYYNLLSMKLLETDTVESNRYYNLVHSTSILSNDLDFSNYYNLLSTRMLETDDISSINYYNLLSRKMLETNDIDFNRYYNLVHSTSILSNDLDFSNYYNLLSRKMIETGAIDFSRYYNLVHSASIISSDIDFINYYNLLARQLLETGNIQYNNYYNIANRNILFTDDVNAEMNNIISTLSKLEITNTDIECLTRIIKSAKILDVLSDNLGSLSQYHIFDGNARQNIPLYDTMDRMFMDGTLDIINLHTDSIKALTSNYNNIEILSINDNKLSNIIDKDTTGIINVDITIPDTAQSVDISYINTNCTLVNDTDNTTVFTNYYSESYSAIYTVENKVDYNFIGDYETIKEILTDADLDNINVNKTLKDYSDDDTVNIHISLEKDMETILQDYSINEVSLNNDIVPYYFDISTNYKTVYTKENNTYTLFGTAENLINTLDNIYVADTEKTFVTTYDIKGDAYYIFDLLSNINYETEKTYSISIITEKEDESIFDGYDISYTENGTVGSDEDNDTRYTLTGTYKELYKFLTDTNYHSIDFIEIDVEIKNNEVEDFEKMINDFNIETMYSYEPLSFYEAQFNKYSTMMFDSYGALIHPSNIDFSITEFKLPQYTDHISAVCLNSRQPAIIDKLSDKQFTDLLIANADNEELIALSKTDESAVSDLDMETSVVQDSKDETITNTVENLANKDYFYKLLKHAYEIDENDKWFTSNEDEFIEDDLMIFVNGKKVFGYGRKAESGETYTLDYRIVGNTYIIDNFNEKYKLSDSATPRYYTIKLGETIEETEYLSDISLGTAKDQREYYEALKNNDTDAKNKYYALVEKTNTIEQTRGIDIGITENEFENISSEYFDNLCEEDLLVYRDLNPEEIVIFQFDHTQIDAYYSIYSTTEAEKQYFELPENYYDKKNILAFVNGYKTLNYKIFGNTLWFNNLEKDSSIEIYVFHKNSNLWIDEEPYRQYFNSLSDALLNSDIDKNDYKEITTSENFIITDDEKTGNITIPVTYTVGTNELVVYYNGLKLYKDYQYKEVGTNGKKSSKIKLLFTSYKNDEFNFVINTHIVNVTTTKITENTDEFIITLPFSYRVGHNKIHVSYNGLELSDNYYTELGETNSISQKVKITFNIFVDDEINIVLLNDNSEYTNAYENVITYSETYELPITYTVGNNDYEIFYNGLKLYKNINYYEVGDTGDESSTIKFDFTLEKGDELYCYKVEKCITYTLTTTNDISKYINEYSDSIISTKENDTYTLITTYDNLYKLLKYIDMSRGKNFILRNIRRLTYM